MKFHRPVLVAVVGVLLAGFVALRQSPHLAFRVPRIGWLFFFATGEQNREHTVISKCVDPEKCEWLTPGDVVVDACMKCGTNWLMTIVHELRTWNQTHLKDFRDILEISPWLELRQFGEDYPEDRPYNWGNEWNNPQLPFKQYKSHLDPHYQEKGMRAITMPVRERRDIKFLVMVRNPADMMVSFKHFMPARDPAAGQEVFAGFPPLSWSIETILWIHEMFPSSPLIGTNFFKTWYEYKDEPNVLMLHYTDVFNDLPRYVRLIADFIGVTDITEAGLEEAQRRTSVQFMKEGDRYRHRAGRNHSVPILLPKSLVRKGGVTKNSDESEMTTAERNKLESLILDQISPELAHILYNGFDA